jgi:hypothetical protein
MHTLGKLTGTYFVARTAVNGAIARLNRMPMVLRIICTASLFTGLTVLVMSVIQIGFIGILGEKLSWPQVRAAGYYPFLILFGLAMTTAGIGIWAQRGWSRWFVVLTYLFLIPVEIIHWRSHPEGSTGSPSWGYNIATAVCWAGIFYWYLFYKQKTAFD